MVEISSKLSCEFPEELIDWSKLEKLRSVKCGVYVSIEKIVFSEGMYKRILRGCMGSVKPLKDLVSDVKIAAIYAAFNDPRFSPISVAELKNSVIELILISNLKQVNLDEIKENFILGYHGLLLQRSSSKNVLTILPHKVIEWAEQTYVKEGRKFTVEDLVNIVSKYVRDDTQIYMFETQILYELEPLGRVVERKLYLNKYLQNQRNLS